MMSKAKSACGFSNWNDGRPELDESHYAGGVVGRLLGAQHRDAHGGVMTLRSYVIATYNLYQCIEAAAIEEARTRHVLSRVWKKYGAELRAARGRMPCR